MAEIKRDHLEFLKKIEQNNNKPWFTAHKKEFDQIYSEVKLFFKNVYEQIALTDSIERFHVHRIYRDLRFSKDKTPYKTHFRLYLGRTKPLLRGGYYLNIQPGMSRVSGGFWKPESKDLLRIRKEIDADAQSFRQVLNDSKIREIFGELRGEELMGMPRGFDKDSPGAEYLRKKQFILTQSFTDDEVLSPGFMDEAVASFKALRPFFDYMSEVLTTDENGVSLF